jgi:hypothetical protein
MTDSNPAQRQDLARLAIAPFWLPCGRSWCATGQVQLFGAVEWFIAEAEEGPNSGSLLDHSQGTGWSSDAPNNSAPDPQPKFVVLELPVAVNIGELQIIASNTCGERGSSSTGDYKWRPVQRLHRHALDQARRIRLARLAYHSGVVPCPDIDNADGGRADAAAIGGLPASSWVDGGHYGRATAVATARLLVRTRSGRCRPPRTMSVVRSPRRR